MSDIMEDMEPGVLVFIKRHIRSFTCWDLLRFLFENPGTWDTTENLARYVGRQVERVESEVRLMTSEGLLRQDNQGPKPVYALTQDLETLDLIKQLVSASQDRAFRMKLVYHILRAGGNE
jgi:hypothetical protein